MFYRDNRTHIEFLKIKSSSGVMKRVSVVVKELVLPDALWHDFPNHKHTVQSLVSYIKYFEKLLINGMVDPKDITVERSGTSIFDTRIRDISNTLNSSDRLTLLIASVYFQYLFAAVSNEYSKVLEYKEELTSLTSGMLKIIFVPYQHQYAILMQYPVMPTDDWISKQKGYKVIQDEAWLKAYSFDGQGLWVQPSQVKFLRYCTESDILMFIQQDYHKANAELLPLWKQQNTLFPISVDN